MRIFPNRQNELQGVFFKKEKNLRWKIRNVWEIKINKSNQYQDEYKQTLTIQNNYTVLGIMYDI